MSKVPYYLKLMQKLKLLHRGRCLHTSSSSPLLLLLRTQVRTIHIDLVNDDLTHNTCGQSPPPPPLPLYSDGPARSIAKHRGETRALAGDWRGLERPEIPGLLPQPVSTQPASLIGSEKCYDIANLPKQLINNQTVINQEHLIFVKQRDSERVRNIRYLI